MKASDHVFLSSFPPSFITLALPYVVRTRLSRS